MCVKSFVHRLVGMREVLVACRFAATSTTCALATMLLRRVFVDRPFDSRPLDDGIVNDQLCRWFGINKLKPVLNTNNALPTLLLNSLFLALAKFNDLV
jgi:hypothetical protein